MVDYGLLILDGKRRGRPKSTIKNQQSPGNLGSGAVSLVEQQIPRFEGWNLRDLLCPSWLTGRRRPPRTRRSTKESANCTITGNLSPIAPQRNNSVC
jgi:hypothetical protein